jgi:membrane protease YdiL (CAAX protease family)
MYPTFNTGMIGLKRDTWFKLIIFTISTIILPPITEELFFRKNLISFKNKKVLIITTILSMFLYALEHSLSIFGIILTMIWALPLSISYIKTKNIYVPMTAHFIGNLLGNGIDIILTIISMI